MSKQIPLVDYLVLGDEPHLVAHECTSCGARYFDRRNACASCGGTDVHDGRRSPPRASCGRSRSCRSRRPGSRCRSWPAVVDCGGTSVRANVDQRRRPTPSTCTLGMKVKLATYLIGTDDEGTEAIGFGFEPV